MDSQSRNKVIQTSFSLVVGIMLFASYLIFCTMFPTAGASLTRLFLLVILPAFTYVFSMGMNSLVQFISCGTISIQQVALASLAPVGFLILFGGLASSLPFLQSPVLSAVSWVPDSLLQNAIAIGFYLFWAGAYGEAVAAGFVSGCPTK